MSSNILLRVALAFAFLYPPINAVSNPDAWIGFFPHFLLGHVPNTTLLYSWGAVQIVIALWILSGKRILIPSLLACVSLSAIVLFNLPAFYIVFRDLSLALVAVALAWQSYTKTQMGA